MKYKLGQLGTVYSGGTPSTKDAEFWDGDIAWITPKDLAGYSKKKISKGERNITDAGLSGSSANLIPAGSVLMSSRAPIGYVAIADNELSTNQGFKSINCDERICLNEYIYYWIKSNIEYIKSKANGSTFKEISGSSFKNLDVDVPDLETQKKIVRILSALDRKIELNNQQNETLFELGRQLYIEKFENNQTIDKVELGIFFPVITGKKDANASSENGKYPFFTCSKTISKIDDYVFDASAILLAGNGDFNVKFYRGKFDAYQRTYVLIPNNPEYLGFLYWAISYNLPTITANYRGSVIKFITKGNIESFKVPFVDNKYIPTYMKYLEKIEKNNQQNEVLAGLRDVLLPKLMSGEINLGEL